MLKRVQILLMIFILSTIFINAAEYEKVITNNGRSLLVEKSIIESKEYKETGYMLLDSKGLGKGTLRFLSKDLLIETIIENTEAYKLIEIDTISDNGIYISLNLEDKKGNKFSAEFKLLEEKIWFNSNYNESIKKENFNNEEEKFPYSDLYNFLIEVIEKGDEIKLGNYDVDGFSFKVDNINKTKYLRAEIIYKTGDYSVRDNQFVNIENNVIKKLTNKYKIDYSKSKKRPPAERTGTNKAFYNFTYYEIGTIIMNIKGYKITVEYDLGSERIGGGEWKGEYKTFPSSIRIILEK